MFTELDLGSWEPSNFQPSKADRGPVCPHYQIISICAPFVGISEEHLAKTVRFCGVYSKDFDTMSRIGGGEKGADETALATCKVIYEKFRGQLAIAKTPATELPSEEEIGAQMDEASFEEKGRIFLDYKSTRKKYEERAEILARWKDVVFGLAIIPVSESQQVPHFRKVDSPEDLTDDEAINYATAFFNGLEKVVGKPEKNIFSIYGKAAKNCDRSPSSGHYAWGHSD